ncbi:MAG: ATP-grasp domain-containing protein [Deltaproteobacteria bacterium]|nr:ATP-grasp domain-containing protein [Deltaproteobacteria bacterium]
MPEEKIQVKHGNPLKYALGRRLANCPYLVTLGIRPNLTDYEPWQIEAIKQAEVIYFPTKLYAHSLSSMGKRIFPGINDYEYAGDKIKQATLFNLLDLPFPRTKCYYGRQTDLILKDFDFPFVAKLPRASDGGRGVFLVRQPSDLAAYRRITKVALVQEFLNIESEYRVVVIAHRIALVYRRGLTGGDFRGNLSQGAQVAFGNIPSEVSSMAQEVSRRCRFDDVGLDICLAGGRYYLLEANMLYGRAGFKLAGLDYKRLLCDLIGQGVI